MCKDGHHPHSSVQYAVEDLSATKEQKHYIEHSFDVNDALNRQ